MVKCSPDTNCKCLALVARSLTVQNYLHHFYYKERVVWSLHKVSSSFLMKCVSMLRYPFTLLWIIQLFNNSILHRFINGGDVTWSLRENLLNKPHSDNLDWLIIRTVLDSSHSCWLFCFISYCNPTVFVQLTSVDRYKEAVEILPLFDLTCKFWSWWLETLPHIVDGFTQ